MSCLEFIAAMPVTAQLRTAALFVAFLAILFWDRRADTWIKCNVLLGTLGGLSYYFNPAGPGHLEGKTGPLHEYMVQVLGAMMLSQVYLIYSLSSDNATRLILFLAQALGGIMVLVIRTYGHFKYQNDSVHFDNEHLTFGLPMAGLIALGGCIFLYRQNGSSGRTEGISKGGLNTYLLVDGFIFCLFGLGDLAFPDISLSMVEGVTPDGVLATFSRHCGGALLLEGILSFLFLALSNDEDKKAKLRFSITLPCFYLPLAVLYQIKYQWVALPTLLIAVAVSLLPTANAACALYIRDRMKKRV